jgi:LysR family transcriptional regulator, glycine cleavage system transcriptional activator
MTGTKKLPPLNAVRAFEAAARHVNFTKAAAELHVTHGAISRHIAVLEEWLGVALFVRTASRLVLTESGQRYLADIAPSLARIADASSDVQRPGGRDVLRVNVPPTFAMRWLIPRMSTFQRRFSDTEIRLTASTEPLDFEWKGYDVAIRGTLQAGELCQATPFMTVSYAPVCHVDLMREAGLVDVAQLAQQKLITYSREPLSWPNWLRAAGAPDLQPQGFLPFEQMSFALQAAVNGLGIALMPMVLAADDLAMGRLVAPFGRQGSLVRTYYAHYPAFLEGMPLIRRFCDWLADEGRETEKMVSDGAQEHLKAATQHGPRGRAGARDAAIAAGPVRAPHRRTYQ